MDKLMALTTASLLITNAAFGQELPRLDEAVTWYNQAAVRNFAPVFDFDSDGCYPATPFDKNNNLAQNKGEDAAWKTPWGGCRDTGWELFANTMHRQLCHQTDNQDQYCAHFYELYFEKDQSVHWSFAGGHRHDVETVIVWTVKESGNEYISHVSTSAHGNYDTRAFNEVLQQNGHPMVVYHKDGIGTHAFRYANQQDKETVEFLGNWGVFYTPVIVSHYRGTDTFYSDSWDRYWANKTYRETLEASDFGSASFKTRQENVMIDQANTAKPNSGGWQQVTFSAFDAAQTRHAEFQANYADIASQINE
ncbi:NPP1 family protein [Pseudoalteromonas sp. L21]|uniref:NPP1 family protein n=1 Tax=Pseudoalteromonas sp. L21 TaxID=1539746 RepID=UPI001F2C4DD0|nr:NPP1 family protein [Pseudoalteromonas sp. L21]MCF7517467.1 NPP1 family protein [Pseudoalteromonas sp. L21]